MKTIKYLFLLIILGLLGTIIYQNLEYFMTPYALTIDLKVPNWQWTAPALPNLTYWGICFGLGLLLTGIKGLFTAFRLGREIKNKNSLIGSQRQEISELQTKLDVFVHDPYIKNGKEKSGVEKSEPEIPVAEAEVTPEISEKGDSKKL
ncbi:MAG: hypothetical protein B6230_00070 [Desulfobacteraceae bacterium 4572_89]|nr:MAG: hypothetical protein B6230_00070 [Desulfobacteraceae bacterium 4572_89]